MKRTISEAEEAVRKEVEAKRPDIELVWHKKDSYVDREADSFYIHRGNDYLGSVHSQGATAYWILEVIHFYEYAYNLATERAESKFIAKLCDTFNLQEKDDED